ncbi:hypothetical protein E9529_19410 [Blastococcus sp. KM273128]|uniref:hypothetical protein n=1 Tax=Blastococcus sp. KM273128 TaxID=2570314 RepID=UPI001F334888|nr:hypothetical protein [Blastococcus sp. KM273128]MCF6746399.1 hypothetical protein [Blastococcus sp. KM273128]
MAESGTRSPEPHEGWRRALRWWGRAGAFLAGLFLGAVLVGLLSGGTVVVANPVPLDRDVADPLGADGGDAEGGATGRVTIDEDCLRAVNAAQDVAQLVDEMGEAIAALNAARMDEVVRRLQPLQRRLQASLESCEVRAGAGGGPSGVEPTPSSPFPGPPAPASPSATD